ncbi:MAG: hypothetical protein RLZZ500_1852 [Bacteroidota bacterium]|jgi:hypothetical protein
MQKKESTNADSFFIFRIIISLLMLRLHQQSQGFRL